MRTNVTWAALVIVTALIEATWLGVIRFHGVLPDLVILLVVYFAIADGEERAMMTGLLGGILQDVAGDTGLGHHVLCLVVAGYLAGRISRRLVTDHPAVKAGLVFGATLVHGLLYIVLDYVGNPDMNALHTIAVSVIPQAFYTALATPVVFFLLSRSTGGPEIAHGGTG